MFLLVSQIERSLISLQYQKIRKSCTNDIELLKQFIQDFDEEQKKNKEEEAARRAAKRKNL